MTISIQAPNFISAHRPVEYFVESDSTALAIEKLLVKCYVNGALVATFRKDWYQKTLVSGMNYNYFFRLDNQAILRNFLAPLSSASPLPLVGFTGDEVVATDSVLKTYCEFQLEFRNAQNLLETSPTVVTSNTVSVFNVIRQHDESLALQPYLLNSGRKFLTDIPNGTLISEFDAFSLSIIYKEAALGTSLLLELQKVSGNTYHTAPVTALTPADEKVLAVGVGPKHWANWVWSATTPIIDATVTGYKIGFGFIDETGATFTSQTISFVIAPRCHTDFRLHFMNQRGGMDAYTFSGRKLKAVEGRNTQAQRPLDFNTSTYAHDAQQKGAFTLQPDRMDVWEIESRIESEEVAEWLGQLAASPEVYAELPDYLHYVPVYLTDVSFVVSDTEQVGMILKAKVFKSNKALTHTH